MSISAVEQLAKGSFLGYDTLMDVHDRLAVSADPYMRYAAGWAALYASQKHSQPGADEAFQLALGDWADVTAGEQSLYDDDPQSLSLKARLCVAIGDQIRHERETWSSEERFTTFTRIGGVAIECLRAVGTKNSRSSIGQLTELVCLQLLWRPSEVLRPLNAVPAGPGKDARPHPKQIRFNTDIYALNPGISAKKKGANIQVKTTLKEHDREKYDPMIVLIGGNTHLHHPDARARSHARVRFTAQACVEESLGVAVTEATASALDLSSAQIHRDIRDSIQRRHMSRFYTEKVSEPIDLRDGSLVETER